MLVNSVSVGLFLPPGKAAACATMHELDLNYISNAQVVVRAKMISYQPVFDPELQKRRRDFLDATSKKDSGQLADKLSGRSADSIQIRLEVVETISGSPRLHGWEANWVHSTFGMAEQWTGPQDVIIGLRAAIDRHGMPFVQVVQQPCAPTMILEDNPENRKAVIDAIAAQSRRRAGYVFQ